MIPRIATALAAGLLAAAAAAHEEKPYDAREQWWWDEAWWEEGRIEPPANHRVRVRWASYMNGEVEVPAMIARPDDGRRYPAVLFQHGRRGLDDLVQLQVRRIAARGFVVVAPDVFTARFIPKFPIEHDYAVEGDVDKGVDFLLSLPDVSTTKACLASHTRGGYMTLKVAVKFRRQEKDVACYVSWYPHMQDPNAPEPMQVYRFAPEAERLTIPVLVFVGEHEQYQRRRPIEMAIATLRRKGRDATLVVYPGVGRGFDFRPPNVRTFADDLASKDAVVRAARFMRAHLEAWKR